MMKLIYIFAIALLSFEGVLCDEAPTPPPAEGEDAQAPGSGGSEGESVDGSSVPHQVILALKKDADSYEFHCSGSLFEEDQVITAAHCFYNNGTGSPIPLPDFRVYAATKNLGEFSSTFSTITATREHPDFNQVNGGKGFENDFTVVQLESPFELNDNIKTVEFSDETPGAGTSCKIAGWGSIVQGSSPTGEMKEDTVHVYDKEKCEGWYKNVTDVQLHEATICIGTDEGDKGVCLADSGTPLICDNYLAGIASFEEGCSGADSSPKTVFMDISHFMTFIENKETVESEEIVENNANTITHSLIFIFVVQFSTYILFK